MMNSASYSTDLYNSEMDNLYRMVKSETRRDPCFKMRARDFRLFVKSEPETGSSENTSPRHAESKIRAR